jgi:hypothetical protein
VDVQERGARIRKGIRIGLLSFEETPVMRSDCLAVTPARGRTKTAGIIWMHSGGFFEQLPDAVLLAEACAVWLPINPVSPN